MLARPLAAAILALVSCAASHTTVDVLDHFILVNSTEVAMGEQPVWEE